MIINNSDISSGILERDIKKQLPDSMISSYKTFSHALARLLINKDLIVSDIKDLHSISVKISNLIVVIDIYQVALIDDKELKRLKNISGFSAASIFVYRDPANPYEPPVLNTSNVDGFWEFAA